MEDLKQGDVVTLKSGSIKMTVSYIDVEIYGTDIAGCVYERDG